ncbi:large conductance mechanosensitive channel [Geodermatophilus tzadiensis]|uniref:Large conductance mechanosensitive channel n=1 Tax=Geodermatophilus tzadiensis TaxID=1137988 RepID=A0A2T0TUH3_9ACTN|nr:MscL family protein [Geodermatophilus tzadiensis]PRY49300.1 large conductance mechanosensitive channel [Geodermatophilus tzadiensis]
MSAVPRGFEDFLLRGNVVELAVAVVVGAAFTAVVDAFVSQVMTFVLTAAVVYVIVVLPLRSTAERRARGGEPGLVAPTQVELLAEIRDLLATAPGGPGTPAR